MAIVHCRLCGSQSVRRFSAFGYAWLDCRTCQAVQKVLTEAEFGSLKPTYDAGEALEAKSAKELEEYLALDEKVAVLRSVLNRELGGVEKSSLRFLDVGCGMGGYLIAAQRLGLIAHGFEPNVEHARVATHVLGLPVVNDYFRPGRDSTQYHFIMLSHVIEHVYHQAEFLDGLVRSLVPGGVLLVITPNSHSAIASVCGRYWPMLRPIDHVSLLSAKTFRHFVFSVPTETHHTWGGYSYEFAATILATLRNQLRGEEPSVNGVGVGVLRTGSRLRKYLTPILTAASLPARLLPSDRQPCLITTIKRVS